MTEHQWMEGVDGEAILDWAICLGTRTASPRKLRLIACAISRWLMVGCKDGMVAQEHADMIRRAELWAETNCRGQVKSTDTMWSAMDHDPADGVRQLARLSYTSHVIDDGFFCGGHIIRDVVGNPFRLTDFCSKWRTPDVLTVATAAYIDRRPDGTLDLLSLKALSDALEEIGYQNGDVLAALRSEGRFFRGYWPLDLILGKK